MFLTGPGYPVAMKQPWSFSGNPPPAAGCRFGTWLNYLAMNKSFLWLLPLFFAGTLLAAACSKKSSAPPAVTTNTVHVYYVAPGGNDAASGTADDPLHTINTALNKAIPGDTVIVRAGTYYQKVAFPRSGRLDKSITLKAYPGERPVIDGTGLSISGKEALVTISNASYTVLEGFDICNYKTSASWVNINGILVTEGSGNVTLRNNHIYNIENNAAPADGRSGHGIEIIGNTGTLMKNILVEGNEIHDCNTGYSENLTINGYVDSFTIRNNKIYNGENIGIDAAGGYSANSVPDLNYARNGLISGNEIYDIDMTTGPIGVAHGTDNGHGAIGIYIDGARNITVERNKVHECDRGIGIVSENDNFPTSNCIVRNNFVYNSWRTGIYLGGYLNYTTGGTNDCYVVNNTLYYNDRGPGAFGEIEGELRLTERCNNDVLENNIVYGRPTDVLVHKYTSTGSNNVVDHNLYYTTGTPVWIWEAVTGSEAHTLADWQSVSGMDVQSTDGPDPQLVSTAMPDLHIQEASPAVNSGAVISAAINGSTDIDGKARIVNNQISKGAQQTPGSN